MCRSKLRGLTKAGGNGAWSAARLTVLTRCCLPDSPELQGTTNSTALLRFPGSNCLFFWSEGEWTDTDRAKPKCSDKFVPVPVYSQLSHGPSRTQVFLMTGRGLTAWAIAQPLEAKGDFKAASVVACCRLVPKFANSNPAEAVGFFRAKKFSARLLSEGK